MRRITSWRVAGFDEDAGLLDAVSLLLALAPVTTTLRLGAMVSPITIRHPVVLARAMQTLDLISGGRAEVGVGGGWSWSEHEIFGLPFPGASRRLDLLEDACRTLVSLWESADPVHKEGDFPLHGARLSPSPIQPLTPPLVAGASDHAVRIAGTLGPGLETRPVLRRSWASGCTSSERRKRELPGRERWRSRPQCGSNSRESEDERQAKAQAVRDAPRARYAQREVYLAGEDPVAAL